MERIMSDQPNKVEQTGAQREPMSKMRKAIARMTTLSVQTIPHFYSQIEIDMLYAQTTITELRARHPDVKVSLLHLLIKVCAAALQKHPRLNASLDGETIVYNSDVNIGVVVALEDGMLIPVVHTAEKTPLLDLAAQTASMVDRARRQRSTAEDLLGGTFTLSNLGKEGPDSFTSIIRPTLSAILSLGTVVDRPFVRAGQLVVAPTMIATLGVDHRVVDGAHAAGFLVTFKRIFETPELAELCD
jgi:pyruvate dehydrogenase E2 component (dihydrolipoamide acetyltransferase)